MKATTSGTSTALYWMIASHTMCFSVASSAFDDHDHDHEEWEKMKGRSNAGSLRYRSNNPVTATHFQGDDLRRYKSSVVASLDSEYKYYGCGDQSNSTIAKAACFCGLLNDAKTDADLGTFMHAASGIECRNGAAGRFPCSNVKLEAFLPLSTFGASGGSDIWGWTDPTSQREFAIYGVKESTVFVEITNPSNPIYKGKLRTATSASSWRDIKVYQGHAFIVSEASSHGMQVFDLSRLLNAGSGTNFDADAWYRAVGSMHNMAVNEETGYAYLVGGSECRGGLYMVDIRDPLNPTKAGCFDQDGYTHDAQCVIYRGPDQTYNGREVCFCSNEDTITIVDVTSKSNPVLISRTSYAKEAYTHQGWLSSDQQYFVFNDELDETKYGFNTRTLVLDVSTLDNPTNFRQYLASTRAVDHNLYIAKHYAQDFIYQANYRAGLRILKVNNYASADFEEVAHFDIYPSSDGAGSNGAWSVYPYFSSGTVVVSGIGEGLFVLKPKVVVDPPNNPDIFVCKNRSAKSWSGHVSKAAEQGGQLLSVLNQDMTNYLVNEFPENGKYWIGYSDIDNEARWTWADGSSSSYNNWKAGQPSNSGSSGEDCAEFLGPNESGQWNDLPCLTGRWAFYQFPMSEFQNVCNQYTCLPGPGNAFSETCGGTEEITTTTTTTTTTAAPSDPVFVCRVTSPKNWADHVSTAVSDGGNLLTISDKSMNDYLLSGFPQNGKYWIGYNDIASEGQFVWADGTTFQYENWTNNQPSNSGMGEDCVEYLGPGGGGRWNDLSCTTNRWAFYQFPFSVFQDVCDKYTCLPGPGNSFSETCGVTTTTATSPITTTTAAPSDPEFVCRVTSPKKWEDHVSAAVSDGGNLLTISDKTMNSYLLSSFPPTGKYWIGYNDIASEGQFVWSDGTMSEYENWTNNQPSNSGMGEDCVEFIQSQGGQLFGEWNDLACTTNRWAYYQFPFSEFQDVCHKYACLPGPVNSFSEDCGDTTTTSTSSTTTTTAAPSDPVFVCRVTSLKKWEDHDSSATSKGGNLLTIPDSTMNQYLLDEFPPTGKYWIGFNDIATEGNFVWEDGSSSSYTNWGGSSPNNAGNGEDCTEYIQSEAGQLSGKWNDNGCNINRWAYYQFPFSEYQNVCDQFECLPGPGNLDFSQTCGGAA